MGPNKVILSLTDKLGLLVYELKMQEIFQKMTGSFFYENLEIDLQAWAFAASLRDQNKTQRSEN